MAIFWPYYGQLWPNMGLITIVGEDNFTYQFSSGSTNGVRDAASSWLRSYLSQSAAIRQAWSPLVGRHAMRLRRSTRVRSRSAVVYCLHSTFGVCCHQFADDTQLFIAMNAADTAPAPDRLTLCSDAVKQWSLQNNLQLNAGKSEVILLGTTVQLRSAADITTIDIAGSPLPVALK